MRTFDDFTQPGFWQAPLRVFQDCFRDGHRVQASPDGGIAILGYNILRVVGLHPAIDGTPMALPAASEPETLNEILRHGLFTQVVPAHRHMRKAVLAGLNRQAIAAFGDKAMDLLRRRLVGLGKEPFDIFSELTLPFAAETWGAFLGYSPDAASTLVSEIETLGHQLSFEPDPSRADDAEIAARSMLSRTADMIDRKMDGTAARMAAASPNTNPAALIASLNFDAVDTAAAGLAGILAILMEEGVDRGALSDFDYREQAIEEALRLATPAVLTVRQAREEVTIAGHTIRKDAMVWMWWSAGNCDPEAFPEPARFRPGRRSRGLPFGIGSHSCVGHGWTKQLAHILIENTLVKPEALHPVSPGIQWVIGGARRPKRQMVLWR